jgi:hypothetical protein
MMALMRIMYINQLTAPGPRDEKVFFHSSPDRSMAVDRPGHYG